MMESSDFSGVGISAPIAIYSWKDNHQSNRFCYPVAALFAIFNPVIPFAFRIFIGGSSRYGKPSKKIR